MSEKPVFGRFAHRWAPDCSRGFGNLPAVTDQLVSPEVAAVSDLIDLTGRRALLTGGAKGIGVASFIVRTMRERGM